MEKKVAQVTLQLQKGDIAAQRDIDAVVNAANAWLRPGGGVAGALHRGAGPGLEEEGRPLAPIKPGEAVITGGHNLPNDYVIHCLGPVYGVDRPSEKLLADCYRNALDLAEEKGLTSVAFPAISSGAFGYPKEDAARVALETVVAKAPELKSLSLVRFVLYDQASLDVHCRVLESL